MNLKKIAALAALSLVLIAGCAAKTEEPADKSLSSIEEKGKLIIGFTEYPPMGFMENGVATGFDLDIAKEVCKRLGVEPVFQYIDWDAKVMELNAGNIDVIWNGMSITPDREKEMLFSKPYFDSHIAILVKADSTINAIADLAGKKVGVEIASASADAVEANAIYSSIDEEVKFQTITEAILALNSGTIDAIVADEIFARYAVAKEASAYRIADESFASDKYGIGFRLGDVALRDKIDATLDEMAADGSAKDISVKWFGADLLLR